MLLCRKKKTKRGRERNERANQRKTKQRQYLIIIYMILYNTLREREREGTRVHEIWKHVKMGVMWENLYYNVLLFGFVILEIQY